ncbi:hypothetical protein niasHT_033153 [Heterodera trifolii]|uniref:BTB/POZ domain-containing protein n=1 Tax=Heterodera trifolii TaxID=157864 RepID=A0ABD2J5B7_9BILA
MDQMKYLLSTDEHSDVHFLVGDGDAKEVLPAHKLILKNASDVFEAMFRFDSQNGKSENVPAIVILDVEAEAFKVMLSFIYTDDLSELNGDNSMAVLYAAKKYNIPGLVDASLKVPFSELQNVFFAYAQALLFQLEDFANKCLRFICQNAAQLFRSNQFLQIDQNMLSVLLDSDHLLISDEFEIWKAALRWANEKCRQNSMEISSNNCRSVLGPALFKIRLPNIHEEDFSKCVVPSDLLTVEEVLGVYQFNSHPNLFLLGVPGLYSLKFPSHGRISDWNIAKDNKRATIALRIEKMSKFARESVGNSRFSCAVFIKGLAWKIEAEIRKNTNGIDENKCLGFFLWCDSKQGKASNRVFSATFRIVSEKSEAASPIGTLCDCAINRSGIGQGFGNFIAFEELMDPSNGFHNREKDKVTLAIDITVKAEKMEKKSDPNKSKRILSMEIEKMSEFAREIFSSERKSETVYIKGFPWKICAKITTKKGSTDNEKCLGIYLLCAAPEEDSNWRCCVGLAIFRIVSQKSGKDNTIGTLCDCVFDNKSISGFPNFIPFAELMDPSNGFHNREEDKVTLVVDFTMKDEKTEKFVFEQSKSKGTLSMEIEKVSEFAREVLESVRKSETVYIKRFPWKIWAEIQRNGSTDNEKWLGIYLLCAAPEEEDENWSCKCSATFRIVSQKSGIADNKKELSETIYNSESTGWGFKNFIPFGELMDPCNGLYDQNEDKVTLAIDFTVNEAKTEDNT